MTSEMGQIHSLCVKQVLKLKNLQSQSRTFPVWSGARVVCLPFGVSFQLEDSESPMDMFLSFVLSPLPGSREVFALNSAV